VETLSVEEAAERLGVSRRTVYRWISDGVLAVVEVGRGVRVPVDEVARVSPPARRRTAATDGDVAEHVLAAAVDVLATRGHAALTIENVAEQAGMSVGGVLYHYGTKAALVDGLVDAFLDAVEAEWSAARAAGLGAADAYVSVSLSGTSDQRRVRAVVLAALDRPDATARIDRRVRRWYREIAAESPDPDADLQRCLAADAVWLFGLLGITPLRRSDARRVVGCRGGTGVLPPT
jgi:excisionase family DNA binding protein